MLLVSVVAALAHDVVTSWWQHLHGTVVLDIASGTNEQDLGTFSTWRRAQTARKQICITLWQEEASLHVFCLGTLLSLGSADSVGDGDACQRAGAGGA